MRGVSYEQKKSILEKFAEFIVKQIKGNRTRFFTVIGFTLGIIIFAVFVYVRLSAMDYGASDKLSSAYMFYGQGNAEQGRKALLDTIQYFHKSPASYQARLIMADALTEEKKFDEAVPYLTETIKDGKPDTMRALAAYRLMYVYDAKKDYENAIIAAKDFINKFPDSFLIKDVYLNLARFYTIKGSPEDAKKVYGDILTNFPATGEAETAQEMLNKMK